MRLLIDTNILLYAVNQGCPEHDRARLFLEKHLSSETPWCLTWPILYEFLRVATHPRVFPKPLKAGQAIRFADNLIQCESLSLLTPTARHFHVLQQTLTELSRPAGNLFHDIATAVTLREHGVPEIVTADADFHQFQFLKVTNPILE